ncbi:MAG: hypothetical protein MUF35_05535 [Candidatus Nanopelagicales bacterium]|jgi:secretion/DNA translocation related TadE-like protein|nr:hypothetical protein [Candidatus Nanopelagicales bacterium]
MSRAEAERHLRAAVVRGTGDRGSASVLLALWAVVLTLLAATGVGLSSLLAVRATAAAAADLGALAGASGVLGEGAEPCARAAVVVGANGARLLACRVEGAEVWVEVGAAAPAALARLAPGWAGTVRARAHAELVAATR